MLTKLDILRLEGKNVYFHKDGECQCIVGKRGGLKFKCREWRRNGKTRFWKTKPDAFEIPIKSGFGRRSEDYMYLNDLNCHEFHTDEQCEEHKKFLKLFEEKRNAQSGGIESPSI